MASNLLNYNVNTMSLARTYWGIPSSSFEMGAIPPSPVGFASGLRGDIAPISQDSDGIGRCVLPRLTALYQSSFLRVLKHNILNLFEFTKV